MSRDPRLSWRDAARHLRWRAARLGCCEGRKLRGCCRWRWWKPRLLSAVGGACRPPKKGCREAIRSEFHGRSDHRGLSTGEGFISAMSPGRGRSSGVGFISRSAIIGWVGLSSLGEVLFRASDTAGQHSKCCSRLSIVSIRELRLHSKLLCRPKHARGVVPSPNPNLPSARDAVTPYHRSARRYDNRNAQRGT